MSTVYVIIMALALAMDAFGVTLGIGVSSLVNRNQKIKYLFYFSFFQFFFALLGGTFGYFFDTYIVTIPSILGGIIIAFVGLLMIIDGRKADNTSILCNSKMSIVIGVSVSIDALVLGFTSLNHLGSSMVLIVDCLLIGLVTLTLCTIGFFICKYIRKVDFVCKYANYLGGLALIFLAIKMILF